VLDKTGSLPVSFPEQIIHRIVSCSAIMSTSSCVVG